MPTAAAVAKLKPKTDGAPAVPMDTDDDHNQKLVRPAPDSPPKATGTLTKPKDGASASANSPLVPRRGSISEQDGTQYPVVDFDEYLKLRLGKLIEVANYVSSSAQNLDSTSNILEGAFALERKFPQLKKTQRTRNKNIY